MRKRTGTSDATMALATGTVAGPPTSPAPPAPPMAPAPGAPSTRLLPSLRLGILRRLPAPTRITFGPRAGRAAVGFLIVSTFAIVLAAAAEPTILVPHASQLFPAWEAGPLHLILHNSINNPRHMGYAFSGVLLAMIASYLVVLGALRTISMRLIAGAVIALHVILVLSPPMQLSDLFNYLGYARLGALHGLNPYTHVIRQELFDPVFGYSSWHNLHSPYGPLFSALTYPLAFVSVPVAYWATKIATVLMSLAFLALVWQCARQLGRDPRLAVAFVAFNPIYIVYEVGAFHNDFFMLVPAMAAMSLLLARRYRSAGAVLMLGVAVKFTIVLLLPFLLVAAVTRRRQIQVLVGAAAGAAAIFVLWLALFGFTIPNLSQQSTLLTGTSIPNVVGLILHIGGATPIFLKVCEVGVVVVVVHQFLRNRDWVAGAGWATLALIASLGWLMPWYVVWSLPLAGLLVGRRQRIIAVALTIYLVLAFMNWTAYYMGDQGISLLSTHAGQASLSLQNKLQ